MQDLAGARATTEDLISKLLDKNVLERFSISAQAEKDKDLVRYVRPGVNVYQIALTIAPNSYLSHLTALQVHGIIKASDRKIYVTKEQSVKQVSKSSLLQENVDAAFKKQQRPTHSIYKDKDHSIYLLKGKATDLLGVITAEFHSTKVLTTDPERTLIDAVVRPAHSGGLINVFKAFKGLQPKLSIKKLSAYLDQLHYIYPYHQSIGYLLEQSGYPEKDLQLFERRSRSIRFYLDYDLIDPILNKRWNIYVPFQNQ